MPRIQCSFAHWERLGASNGGMDFKPEPDRKPLIRRALPGRYSTGHLDTGYLPADFGAVEAKCDFHGSVPCFSSSAAELAKGHYFSGELSLKPARALHARSPPSVRRESRLETRTQTRCLSLCDENFTWHKAWPYRMMDGIRPQFGLAFRYASNRAKRLEVCPKRTGSADSPELPYNGFELF